MAEISEKLQKSLDKHKAMQSYQGMVDYFSKYPESSSISSDNLSPENPYSDEYYLNEIEKYKGTKWYEQLLNNPYLRSKAAPYSGSFWENILEGFGDTSARDKYYGELYNSRNQFYSEILAQMRQEEANSAVSQVQQNNLAGINSDLLGTGNVESAPENDQPLHGLDLYSGPSQAQNAMTGIADMSMKFISTIFSFANTIKGFQVSNLDMAGKELSMLTESRDLVRNSIVDSFRGVFSPEDIKDKTDEEIMALGLETIPHLSENKFLPKRVRKFFDAYYNQYQPDSLGHYPLSIKSEVEKLKTQFLKSYKEGVDIQAGPGFSLKASDFIKFVNANISEPMQKVNQALWDFQQKMYKYQSDYYNKLSGESRADAENSANAMSDVANSARKSLMSDYQKVLSTIDSEFKNIENKMSKSKDKDKWYVQLGLMALPFLKSWAKSIVMENLLPDGSAMMQNLLK